jgi:hypothetical protein
MSVETLPAGTRGALSAQAVGDGAMRIEFAVADSAALEAGPTGGPYDVRRDE